MMSNMDSNQFLSKDIIAEHGLLRKRYDELGRQGLSLGEIRDAMGFQFIEEMHEALDDERWEMREKQRLAQAKRK